MNKTRKKSASTYRIQHRFWLDSNRLEEKLLIDYIAQLKSERRFISTIREAFQLIRDLRQGNLGILLRLFPWVKDQFEADFRAQQAEKAVTPPLQEQLSRVEALLRAQSHPQHANAPALLTEPAQPRTPLQLEAPAVELEIKPSASDPEAAKRATQNFMRSLMAIQDAYTPPKQSKNTPKPRPSATQKNGPKAMDVPSFDPPEIDLDSENLL